MTHIMDPFYFDRLLIRIEADIENPEAPLVRSLSVYKVGEYGFDDIDISLALTKAERADLNRIVIQDWEETQDDGQLDPMELSKRHKEERVS